MPLVPPSFSTPSLATLQVGQSNDLLGQLLGTQVIPLELDTGVLAVCDQLQQVTLQHGHSKCAFALGSEFILRLALHERIAATFQDGGDTVSNRRNVDRALGICCEAAMGIRLLGSTSSADLRQSIEVDLPVPRPPITVSPSILEDREDVLSVTDKANDIEMIRCLEVEPRHREPRDSPTSQARDVT
jgi:hypothetical protein